LGREGDVSLPTTATISGEGEGLSSAAAEGEALSSVVVGEGLSSGEGDVSLTTTTGTTGTTAILGEGLSSVSVSGDGEGLSSVGVSGDGEGLLAVALAVMLASINGLGLVTFAASPAQTKLQPQSGSVLLR
jgi:hypothetical protein